MTEKGFKGVTLDQNIERNYINCVKGSYPNNIRTKEEWYDILKKIIDECSEIYSEEVIHYLSYTIDGFIEVAFTNEDKNDLKGLYEGFYQLIKEIALKYDINDVPMIGVQKFEYVPLSRNSVHRPLIGGIQITTYSTSTLTLGVKRNGVNGFVMAGHATEVNGQVWQPAKYVNPFVGVTTVKGDTYADVAFVPCSSDIKAESIIYLADGLYRKVTNYSDPSVGRQVLKSGITTGITSGTVSRYVSIYRNLRNQFTTTFDAAPGDSGAPVFITTSTSSTATVYRLVVGSAEYDEVLCSPVSGVYKELGSLSPVY